MQLFHFNVKENRHAAKRSFLVGKQKDSGNSVKTLKIRVKLILNCPRAHAIT